MTKEVNKFDALAYAVAVLGQPHEVSKNRLIESSHGFVSGAHLWRLPCGRWFSVYEWDDGEQTANAGSAGMTYPSVTRSSDDGSLYPDYEEQARAMIDGFYEAWRWTEW